MSLHENDKIMGLMLDVLMGLFMSIMRSVASGTNNETVCTCSDLFLQWDFQGSSIARTISNI